MPKAFASVFIALILTFALAKDMTAGSEAHRIRTAFFEVFGITPIPCNLEDDIVSFACGLYAADFTTFSVNLDAYMPRSYPGLELVNNWFQNGTGVVRDYRSRSSQYLFVYNPGGYIVLVHVPLQ